MFNTDELKKGLKKEIEEEFVTKIVYWTMALFFLFFLTKGIWGNHIVGHWFELPREYTTQYWIYLDPDKNSTKNYRVKGDISKKSLGGEDGWGYFLETVYWNNGGVSYFYCQLESKSGTYCENDEGKGYVVRLGENIKE